MNFHTKKPDDKNDDDKALSSIALAPFADPEDKADIDADAFATDIEIVNSTYVVCRSQWLSSDQSGKVVLYAEDDSIMAQYPGGPSADEDEWAYATFGAQSLAPTPLPPFRSD